MSGLPIDTINTAIKEFVGESATRGYTKPNNGKIRTLLYGVSVSDNYNHRGTELRKEFGRMGYEIRGSKSYGKGLKRYYTASQRQMSLSELLAHIVIAAYCRERGVKFSEIDKKTIKATLSGKIESKEITTLSAAHTSMDDPRFLDDLNRAPAHKERKERKKRQRTSGEAAAVSAPISLATISKPAHLFYLTPADNVAAAATSTPSAT